MSSTLLPSMNQPASERAAALLRLLEENSQGDYIGESISQLEHSLQCAHLAVKADSPQTTVAAALLHDIGQFLPLPLLQSTISTPVGRPNHALTGSLYLKSLGFPEPVLNIVSQHVNAKRYLVAVDQQYMSNLSEASKASLRQQGGPMAEQERQAWEGLVGWSECVKVRQWDDAAKEVGVESSTPRLATYLDVVTEVLQVAQTE